MTSGWTKLAADGRVERHATSRREILDLRRVIARNLRDASNVDISADNRFGIAYEAALLTAKIAIACAGYRIRGEGGHETTFLALRLAIGPSATAFGDYYEKCRRKRNLLSYERAGVVGTGEVKEIVAQTQRLGELIDAWVSNHHSGLA